MKQKDSQRKKTYGYQMGKVVEKTKIRSLGLADAN